MAYKVKAGEFHVNKAPDTCPACGKGISPIYCYSYGVDTWRRYEGFLQVVYRCPRDECGRLFIAKFINPGLPESDSLHLNKTYILEVVEFEEFPESITDLSEKFEAIYNQSKVAEENGLALIAGPGYRKALEFLVKDYLVKSIPEIEERIKKQTLGDAIKLIENSRIEACASRAAWIGNDETHYVRKWEDKDLKDLKNLIKMVVDWIDLVERSNEYETAMPSPQVSGGE